MNKYTALKNTVSAIINNTNSEKKQIWYSASLGLSVLLFILMNYFLTLYYLDGIYAPVVLCRVIMAITGFTGGISASEIIAHAIYITKGTELEIIAPFTRIYIPTYISAMLLLIADNASIFGRTILFFIAAICLLIAISESIYIANK